MGRLNAVAVLHALDDLYVNTEPRMRDLGINNEDRMDSGQWMTGHTLIVEESCRLAVEDGDVVPLNYLLDTLHASALTGHEEVVTDGVLGEKGLNVLRAAGMPLGDREYMERWTEPLTNAAEARADKSAIDSLERGADARAGRW